jgi:hypothetical protein
MPFGGITDEVESEAKPSKLNKIKRTLQIIGKRRMRSSIDPITGVQIFRRIKASSIRKNGSRFGGPIQPRIFKCHLESCSKIFNDRASLKKHMTVHGDKLVSLNCFYLFLCLSVLMYLWWLQQTISRQCETKATYVGAHRRKALLMWNVQ